MSQAPPPCPASPEDQRSLERLLQLQLGRGFALVVIEWASLEERQGWHRWLAWKAEDLGGLWQGLDIRDLPGQNPWVELLERVPEPRRRRLLCLWGFEDTDQVQDRGWFRRLNVQRDSLIRDLPCFWVLLHHPAQRQALDLDGADFVDMARMRVQREAEALELPELGEGAEPEGPTLLPLPAQALPPLLEQAHRALRVELRFRAEDLLQSFALMEALPEQRAWAIWLEGHLRAGEDIRTAADWIDRQPRLAAPGAELRLRLLRGQLSLLDGAPEEASRTWQALRQAWSADEGALELIDFIELVSLAAPDLGARRLERRWSEPGLAQLAEAVRDGRLGLELEPAQIEQMDEVELVERLIYRWRPAQWKMSSAEEARLSKLADPELARLWAETHRASHFNLSHSWTEASEAWGRAAAEAARLGAWRLHALASSWQIATSSLVSHRPQHLEGLEDLLQRARALGLRALWRQVQVERMRHLSRTGRGEAAAQVWQEELAPQMPSAAAPADRVGLLQARVEGLFHAGRHKEVIDLINQELGSTRAPRHPARTWAYNLRGNSLLRLGRCTEARQDFEAALREASPSSRQQGLIEGSLAQVAAEEGDPRRAEGHLERALANMKQSGTPEDVERTARQLLQVLRLFHDRPSRQRARALEAQLGGAGELAPTSLAELLGPSPLRGA